MTSRVLDFIVLILLVACALVFQDDVAKAVFCIAVVLHGNHINLMKQLRANAEGGK